MRTEEDFVRYHHRCSEAACDDSRFYLIQSGCLLCLKRFQTCNFSLDQYEHWAVLEVCVSSSIVLSDSEGKQTNNKPQQGDCLALLPFSQYVPHEHNGILSCLTMLMESAEVRPVPAAALLTQLHRMVSFQIHILNCSPWEWKKMWVSFCTVDIKDEQTWVGTALNLLQGLWTDYSFQT